MHEVELVLISLLVAVAGLATAARLANIPYPIVLVLGGLVLGFVPGLPDTALAPDLVLVIFLPPLLYSAAFFANLHELRADASGPEASGASQGVGRRDTADWRLLRGCAEQHATRRTGHRGLASSSRLRRTPRQPVRRHDTRPPAASRLTLYAGDTAGWRLPRGCAEQHATRRTGHRGLASSSRLCRTPRQPVRRHNTRPPAASRPTLYADDTADWRPSRPGAEHLATRRTGHRRLATSSRLRRTPRHATR